MDYLLQIATVKLSHKIKSKANSQLAEIKELNSPN